MKKTIALFVLAACVLIAALLSSRDGDEKRCMIDVRIRPTGWHADYIGACEGFWFGGRMRASDDCDSPVDFGPTFAHGNIGVLSDDLLQRARRDFDSESGVYDIVCRSADSVKSICRSERLFFGTAEAAQRYAIKTSAIGCRCLIEKVER